MSGATTTPLGLAVAAVLLAHSFSIHGPPGVVPPAPPPAAAQPPPPLVCPHASAPAYGACAGASVSVTVTSTKEACQAACCADRGCTTWSWDSNLTGLELQQCPPAAAGHTHSPCCYFKKADCAPDPKGRICSLAPGRDCVGWWGSMGSRPPPPNKTVPILCSNTTVYEYCYKFEINITVKLYLQTHLITQLWWSTTYRARIPFLGVLG
jgi:hypothetical protein